MKFTYAISQEDFRDLQQPFTGKAGNNAGFKAALVVCAIISALGVFCMNQGLGSEVGVFLIALGGLAAIVLYFFDKSSVSSAKKKYDKNIEINYSRIHCRDFRAFEISEEGFTVSCKCGTLMRPWKELRSFTENEKAFCAGTNTGAVIIPKSAFKTTSEATEFRGIFSEKLNQDRPSTARHFDFVSNPQDYRKAYWLHAFQGGGWKRLLKTILIYAFIIYGVYVISNSLAINKVPIMCGLIGACLGLPLMKALSKKNKKYVGKTIVHYTDEGLHFQDALGQLRRPWAQYVGYLENESMLLLYINQRVYRMIPKRALMGQAAEFLALTKTKLAPYDYKEPVAKVSTASA